MTGCCLHTHYTGLVDTFVIPRFLRKTLDLQGSMQLFRNNYFLGITLTWAAECHDVHRREFSAVELGHVPGVGHVREVLPRHQHAGRDDLACPQGRDIVRSCTNR